jgi:hypothetical protein
MICWLENDGNDLASTKCHVFLMSCMSSRGAGYYLDTKNFRQNIGAYIARNRNVIKRDWIHDCDRYYAPNIKHVRLSY